MKKIKAVDLKLPDTERAAQYASTLVEIIHAERKNDPKYTSFNNDEIARNRGYESLAHCEAVWFENDVVRCTETMLRLLNSITNKDEKYLNEILHRGNKVSCAVFSHETGIELGKTNKSITQGLTQFLIKEVSLD